ncbi:MAG: DUF4249 domain-containing protein [Bacteroidales bacterium]|nr:DUF4249 domain-containing protein [Bacteroidales bacterium]
MKTQHIIIISCLSIFSFIACETTEKIEDFPLRPSQLVVNCSFSEGAIWEFQVSKSLSVLDNAEMKLIDNATIKLFKGDLLIETLSEQDTDGWYRTENNLPESGQKYSIEVSSPDFENTLLSEEIVPQQILISEASVVVKDSSFYEWDDHEGRIFYGGNVEGSFNIRFSDQADIENYYSLSVFYYDSVFSEREDSLVYWIERRPVRISSDDSAIENDGDNNIYLLFRDLFFAGQGYQLKVEFADWNARRDKVYYVELISFNKAGYLYKKSIDEYYKAINDPFAEPVQIFCNIENGYGIFTAYSKAFYSVSF